jgi:hypothetical protein
MRIFTVTDSGLELVILSRIMRRWKVLLCTIFLFSFGIIWIELLQQLRLIPVLLSKLWRFDFDVD